LERRAPSRFESEFQSKLAEAVLGVPLMQTMPLPNFRQPGCKNQTLAKGRAGLLLCEAR
jgi:hypothetical protein